MSFAKILAMAIYITGCILVLEIALIAIVITTKVISVF